MKGIVFGIGLITGWILSVIIEYISLKISIDKVNIKEKRLFYPIFTIVITGILFYISFINYNLGTMFFKAVVLDCILVVVSFVDFKYKIIPDYIVMIAFVTGVFFLFLGDITFVNGILGMLVGGGVLFLLAIIPGTLGGGDIKLMFAVGTFLGPQGSLWAIFIGFLSAAVISIFLLLLKIKGPRDYIPFGPFLAIGSLIALHIGHNF